MLDLFQIKPHRIVFSILAILVGLILLIMVISGVMMLLNRDGTGYEDGNQNAITFTGEGRVYIKPDLALINLSVVTQGKSVSEVQKKNSEKMNQVIKYLKDFGIEDKDIKTTNYNIYPQYSYETTRVPEIRGYEINQTLEVKIKAMDKIGEIMEGSVEVGINQISSLRFSVEKDDVSRAEARELAIKDAKEKAQETAAQLGIKLDKIIGFYENYNQPYPIYERELGIGGGGPAPDIQVGENEIYVNVSLTYRVK